MNRSTRTLISVGLLALTLISAPTAFSHGGEEDEISTVNESQSGVGDGVEAGIGVGGMVGGVVVDGATATSNGTNGNGGIWALALVASAGAGVAVYLLRRKQSGPDATNE
jgi:hypothetical protein